MALKGKKITSISNRKAKRNDSVNVQKKHAQQLCRYTTEKISVFCTVQKVFLEIGVILKESRVFSNGDND